MKQVSTIAAGIDVAKEQLDVAVHGIKQAWRVPNTPDGFGGLAVLITADRILGKSTDDVLIDFLDEVDPHAKFLGREQ